MRSSHLLLSLLLLVGVCSVSIFAQGDALEAGTKAFQEGQFAAAIPLLKKATSSQPNNQLGWMMLGTSYYRLAKFKDAVKAYERAVELDPQNEAAHANLATAYLARNDKKGEATASETLKINKDNAQANFVLSVYEYRGQYYGAAYDHARRAVQLEPRLAEAYRIIYGSLVSSFIGLNGKAIAPAARSELMTKAVSAFQKYYDLMPPQDQKVLKLQLDDLNFFGEYYSRPEMQRGLDDDRPGTDEPGLTPLKVLTKPKASYTNGARQRMVNGTVLLMVGFRADGTIGPVMVLKSLDRELDQSALIAVRQIKFVPAARNGTPISQVKQVEYSFTIY